MKFMPPLPEGGDGSLRRLLEQIGADKKELQENPIWKEAWAEGYEEGKRDEQRRAQHVISGLVRIYDQEE